MDIVKHCPNCGSVISEEDMEFITLPNVYDGVIDF